MGPSSFRKWYGHVCEIRSFLPCNTPVLALTATATTLTCSTIIKHLNMQEPHMIQMSPNCLNIMYSVVNTSREATEAFQWLVEELGRLRRALPCVIVFCRSITTCSKLYKFFLTELCENSYEPPNSKPCIKTRLFAMFHSRVDDQDKKTIMSSVKDGSCRVIFSTIAFGMGVDIADIHMIIHYGPSKDVDDYLQESGRGGRNGELSHAILYTYPGCTLGYVSPAMKKYVSNTDTCRRRLLLEQFPGLHQFDTLDQHSCCDVCTRECQCQTPCFFQPTRAEQYCIKDSDNSGLEAVRHATEEEKEELKARLQVLREELQDDDSIGGVISNFPPYVIDTVVSQIDYISDTDDLQELCLVWDFASEIMEIVEDIF